MIAYLLESACKLLQHFDAARFKLASKKAPGAVILQQIPSLSKNMPMSVGDHRPTYLPDLRQLCVILQEEAQVLIANVDVRVTAQSPVLFLRLLAPAEPMAVDLIFDLIGRVAHVYARVDVGGAHLCLRALQSGEELRVQ